MGHETPVESITKLIDAYAGRLVAGDLGGDLGHPMLADLLP
jgi:hypothetical protein